jgi:hypothetical protein
MVGDRVASDRGPVLKTVHGIIHATSITARFFYHTKTREIAFLATSSSIQKHLE